MNNILKFSFLQIIMVSEPLKILCWFSFYAINEPALCHAHVAVPSAGPSFHLPLLSTLMTSYYNVALGPCLYSCLRPSPSSAEVSASEISPTMTSPLPSSTRDYWRAMTSPFPPSTRDGRWAMTSPFPPSTRDMWYIWYIISRHVYRHVIHYI